MADTRAQIIISAKDETQNAFRSIKNSLESLTGFSLGSLLGAGGAAALTAAVTSAANFADEMGKAAQKVGTTTEALSGLKHAADLSDVSFETLQKGMEKLARNADMAIGGSKEAAEAFKRIKIDPAQFKDSSELFTAVAEKLSKLPDGAQKTAIAMQLLGKSGAEMLPLLNGGASGLKAMADEAERLGIIVGGDAAKAAETYNDNMERMAAAGKGISLQLVNQLTPAMAEISNAMIAAAKEGGILNGVWVAMGGIMAHVLGIDSASKAKQRIEEINKVISTSQKQLASGSLNPNGAGDAFFNFLIPDVKLNTSAKNTLKKNLSGLIVERDQLLASLKPPTPLARAKAENADPIITPKSGGKKATNPADLWLEDMQYAAKQLGAEERQLAKDMQGVEEALKSQAQAWTDIATAQAQSEAFALSDIEVAAAAELGHVAALESKAQAYRELLDPALKLLNTEAELNDMVANGVLTTEEAAAALVKLGEASNKTNSLAKDIGLTFSSAFEDAVVGGKKFGDVLKSLAMDIEKIILRKTVTEPMTKAIGGWFDNLDFGSMFKANADGGVYAGAGISSYSGSVVSSPTVFPFANGIGLMGEAGAEAILPLTRVNGKLGVQASGGGVVVQNNIQIVEGQGTRASVQSQPNQSGGMDFKVIVEQVTATMSRDINRGDGLAPTLENRYGLNAAAGATR